MFTLGFYLNVLPDIENKRHRMDRCSGVRAEVMRKVAIPALLPIAKYRKMVTNGEIYTPL